MDSFLQKKLGEYKFVFYVFIIILVVPMVLGLFYYYFTSFEKVITIDKTYTRSRRRRDHYMLSDTKNNIYRVSNLWWKGIFTRAEIWESLDSGKKYKVKGWGVRYGLLDMYPNIYSAKLLN